MPGEEVIELSIEETNKLRLKLGLKPLRRVGGGVNDNGSVDVQSTSAVSASNNNNVDEINLSIDETNKLRSKIGLPPLKVSSSTSNSGRKASEAIHAPALNTREQDEIQKRIEDAKLKREVEAGLVKMQNKVLSDSKEDEGGSMLSWAQKMRDGNFTTQTQEKKSRTKLDSNLNKMNDESKKGTSDYANSDFNYQNITVAHSTNEFEAGSTTILTLADKSILGDDDDDEHTKGNQLENVNMTENTKVTNNLKKKRMLEMGVGHAGGYAGYDDDEFEEMSGIGLIAPVDTNNNNSHTHHHTNLDHGKKRKGFKLTDNLSNNEDNGNKEGESELFNSFQGKSVSLISSKQSSIQADYMTYDEEEAISNSLMNRVDLAKKMKKKEKKMLKKLKKKEKSEKKDKNRNDGKKKENNEGQSLLDDLESNVSNINRNIQRNRKRRRVTDDDDSDNELTIPSVNADNINESNVQAEENDVDIQKSRKKKFDSIMQKGNVRTEMIFKKQSANPQSEEIEEEDDDDNFLSVALSKARRLKRLKELNTKENESNLSQDGKGAHAVVVSINSMKNEIQHNNHGEQEVTKSHSTITFELDPTKEFTRMLRSQNNKDSGEPSKDLQQQHINKETSNAKLNEPVSSVEDKIDPSEADVPESLEALADQVKEDQPSDTLGGFGDTAQTVPVGRGISSFLSMLKHTGEITGKNAGKEELRGRAKDERNYEDYEKLDLKEVVKLDTSRGSLHEKDLEFANREVKLEYRDEHGRLLTRKEAWRNLSYQFHGYGSSKKNEEKRLRQIERERAEASQVQKNGNSGTLGALKATQRATGKAFVLHKT